AVIDQVCRMTQRRKLFGQIADRRRAAPERRLTGRLHRVIPLHEIQEGNPHHFSFRDGYHPTSMKLPRIAWSCFVIAIVGLCGVCPAWSHQGHILITRLAALRIIQDPSAPQGLRDFLRQNMAYSMDDCKALATVQYVGPHPEDIQQFDQALDRWATMPDRMKAGVPGTRKIQPYGMPETFMHRLDLEVFSSV